MKFDYLFFFSYSYYFIFFFYFRFEYKFSYSSRVKIWVMRNDLNCWRLRRVGGYESFYFFFYYFDRRNWVRRNRNTKITGFRIFVFILYNFSNKWRLIKIFNFIFLKYKMKKSFYKELNLCILLIVGRGREKEFC